MKIRCRWYFSTAFLNNLSVWKTWWFNTFQWPSVPKDFRWPCRRYIRIYLFILCHQKIKISNILFYLSDKQAVENSNVLKKYFVFLTVGSPKSVTFLEKCLALPTYSQIVTFINSFYLVWRLSVKNLKIILPLLFLSLPHHLSI